MAITLDFESNNPSSNLGRTLPFLNEILAKIVGWLHITSMMILPNMTMIQKLLSGKLLISGVKRHV